MILKPKILTQPNIPVPLHGINPRTIKGATWWRRKRNEAYESTEYHCCACGKESSKLEAHEMWDFNFETGECIITEIVPLCHTCHNFIHSGRLSIVIGKEKTIFQVKAILEHGFKILSKNNLKCYSFTYEFAKTLGCNMYDVKPYYINYNPNVNFYLLFEEKKYSKEF